VKHARVLDTKHRQLHKLTAWMVFVGMRLPLRLNMVRAEVPRAVSAQLSSMPRPVF
jgi:hypothetical protein